MRWMIGLLWVGSVWAAIPYPDFHASMIRGKATESCLLKYESVNRELLQFFESIYERGRFYEEDGQSHIPKIIHQIWLGQKPIPDVYQQWMKTWANLKGWQYKLWTDQDVKLLFLHNRDLYEYSQNYAEKADILRLELLLKYGGLYVDLDYECLKPELFEELNACFDLYMGFEPIQHGLLKRENIFKLCNALIASIPGHPLLKHLVTNLKANYFAYAPFKGPVERTGPSYLTRVVIGYEQELVDTYRNIYFPCTFFYPYSQPDIQKNNIFSLWPETAGIHYWGGSWREKIDSYGEVEP